MSTSELDALQGARGDGALTEGSEGLLTTGKGRRERRDPIQSLDELHLVREMMTTKKLETNLANGTPSQRLQAPLDLPHRMAPQMQVSRVFPRFSAPVRIASNNTWNSLSLQVERLAREPENSPLPPADDMEGLVAAEQSLKPQAELDYLDPKTPSGDNEVIFLGISQEDAPTSGADERGDVGGTRTMKMNWTTGTLFPVPPSDQENPEEDAEYQEEEQLAYYDPPTEPKSDSDSHLHRIAVALEEGTPVTTMPPRQAAYESDSVSHGRSILRVGGSRDR